METPPEILPKAAVDCTHEHRDQCLPEEELVEIISRISSENREREEKGAAHETLVNLVLGENIEDLLHTPHRKFR